MPSTVEYCLSSCDADLLREAGTDGVDLRERRCLEHCGICRDRPFVVADGRVVTGSDLSAVVDAITEAGGERR